MATVVKKHRKKIYRGSAGDTFDSPAGPLVLIVLIGMVMLALVKNHNYKLAREKEPLSPEALKRIEAKVEYTKKQVDLFRQSELGKIVNDYKLRTENY